MAKATSVDTGNWPEARLTTMAGEADPVADAAVELIMADPGSDLARELRRLMADPRPSFDAHLIESYRRLLRFGVKSEADEASLHEPGWIDQDELKCAYEVLSRNSVPYCFTLLFLSLPILYAWSNGLAQTLMMTGQLADKFGRRVAETLRFAIAVIRHGGMGPNGNGIATTLKIRLMHATIRYYAKRAMCAPGDPYFLTAWGLPINQQELVGTMLTFCTLNVDGMRKMGITITPDEDKAIFALWRLVGLLLGIRMENMPQSPADGRAFFQAAKARNFAKTGAGQALIKSHMVFVETIFADPVLSDLLKGLDPALLRYLMGSDVAGEILGVPSLGWRGWWVLFLTAVFGFANRFIDVDLPLKKLLDQYGDLIMVAFETYFAAAEEARPFRIPTKEDAEGDLSTACALR